MIRNQRLVNAMRSGLVAIIAAILMTASLAETNASQSDDNGKLIVNIDDMEGLFNLEAERIRESILEAAFYDAARKMKFLDFKLTYNGTRPKSPRSHLELKVVHLRRSHANVFECSVIPTYYDADGKLRKLGVLHGTRSGISVMGRFDISEHYVDAAEDAFSQALKKLLKTE